MTDLPNDLKNINWSLTTWEGSRRAQLRRWADLPLERIIAALEEMEALAEQFRGDSPTNVTTGQGKAR